MFDLDELERLEDHLVLRAAALEIAQRCSQAAVEARYKTLEQVEASRKIISKVKSA